MTHTQERVPRSVGVPQRPSFPPALTGSGPPAVAHEADRGQEEENHVSGDEKRPTLGRLEFRDERKRNRTVIRPCKQTDP